MCNWITVLYIWNQHDIVKHCKCFNRKAAKKQQQQKNHSWIITNQCLRFIRGDLTYQRSLGAGEGGLLQKITTELICRSLLTCLDAQPCLTLCNPLDYSPSGSSVHGISQARILEWVISSSGGSSRHRDQTHISCDSCIAGKFLTHWTIEEACRRMYVVRITEKGIQGSEKQHSQGTCGGSETGKCKQRCKVKARALQAANRRAPGAPSFARSRAPQA